MMQIAQSNASWASMTQVEEVTMKQNTNSSKISFNDLQYNTPTCNAQPIAKAQNSKTIAPMTLGIQSAWQNKR